MEVKFTRGPFETMANMPESVCKKNDDGSLRWGCRVRPFIGYEVCSDESGRRKECADVARLFRASPLLYEALKGLEWSQSNHRCCPACGHPMGTGHADDCELNNALRVARGEK